MLAESKFNALPIVDEAMRLIDVVTLHDNVNLANVKIRELLPADLPMVLTFFDQMAGGTRAMFNRNDVNRLRVIEHLKRTQADNEIHFAAVVPSEDGELMVGYVFLWDIDKKLPWLGIAVREDWKGHHLGRQLLDHVDSWAKPKGYGGIMLTSVPANVRAAPRSVSFAPSVLSVSYEIRRGKMNDQQEPYRLVNASPRKICGSSGSFFIAKMKMTEPKV